MLIIFIIFISINILLIDAWTATSTVCDNFSLQPSLDWLRRLLPLWILVCKLRYWPLTLRAGVFDSLNPLLNASATICVGAAVKLDLLGLCNQLKTYCACLLFFDWTQLAHQFLVEVHYAPQMGLLWAWLWGCIWNPLGLEKLAALNLLNFFLFNGL
jgi:hypothetical protein